MPEWVKDHATLQDIFLSKYINKGADIPLHSSSKISYDLTVFHVDKGQVFLIGDKFPETLSGNRSSRHGLMGQTPAADH